MLENSPNLKNIDLPPREYKHNNKTLETIEQIVGHLRDDDMWSPHNIKPTHLIDKKMFMES
jgi:hypothetical protein